eukprot:1335856-Alexandrium_andersonii.AAC.1
MAQPEAQAARGHEHLHAAAQQCAEQQASTAGKCCQPLQSLRHDPVLNRGAHELDRLTIKIANDTLVLPVLGRAKQEAGDARGRAGGGHRSAGDCQPRRGLPQP